MRSRRSFSRRLATVLTVVAGTLSPGRAAATADDLPTPDSLSERIDELRILGRYDDALRDAHTLREMYRDDPETKPWRSVDAEVLIRTLETFLRLPEEEREEVAESDRLKESGNQRYRNGDFEAGAAEVERLLEIRERILGGSHPEVASGLNNLGNFYRQLGRYAEAEPLYRRALDIKTEAYGEVHPSTASTMNNCAVILEFMGRYAEAESLYQRALGVRIETLGREDPSVASTLNNLGVLFDLQDRIAEAESLHWEAFRIREGVYGPEHVKTAASMNNLAILFKKHGRYAEAVELYKRSLGIAEAILGFDHPDIATGVDNLANVYVLQSRYGEAESLSRRALAIREEAFGPEHPEVARSLHNLALICGAQGRIGDAERYYEQALRIREKVLGPEHLYVGITLNNLASLLSAGGRYDEGESYFLRSMAILEKAVGPASLELAQCITGFSKLRARQARFAESEEILKRARTIYEEDLGRQHPDVADAIATLGWCRLGLEDYPRAEALLTEAAGIFETARLRAGAESTFELSPYSLLAATRLVMGDDGEAWPAAEASLGRALADLLIASEKRSLDRAEKEREDSLKRALRRIEDRMVALRKASVDGAAADMSSDLVETRTQLFDAEAEWSAFQRAIASKYPVAEGQVYPLERVQASLDPVTAFMGWLHTALPRDRHACWGYIIRDTGPVRWVRLDFPKTHKNEPKPMERAKAYREALQMAASWPVRVGSVERVESDARKLWNDWVGPLTPHLDGVGKLIVLPSGPMLGLPLEALADSTGAFLGELYAVSYAPSATIHAWIQEQQAGRREPPAARRALLVGDPPFHADQLAAMEREETIAALRHGMRFDRGGLLPEGVVLRSALAGSPEALAGLPRLPWTREEVEGIAGVLPQATTLLGPDATEQELVRLAGEGALEGFDLIHLATHAFVDDDLPERSALVLSRSNLPDPLESVMSGKRIIDGLLTAQEIVREWKLDADLVTLSGCHTALGREAPGEGYIGLSYAFLQAGARSLLVSLWRAEDRATCLLMKRFYENLTGSYEGDRSQWRGAPVPKAEALREAKQWLRNLTDDEGRRPFRHPAYWSGFVLIGDPL
ncbi:MAG: tetratricopeptide repeat protein [Candidatus Eisenbacteria bacterium]